MYDRFPVNIWYFSSCSRLQTTTQKPMPLMVALQALMVAPQAPTTNVWVMNQGSHCATLEIPMEGPPMANPVVAPADIGMAPADRGNGPSGIDAPPGIGNTRIDIDVAAKCCVCGCRLQRRWPSNDNPVLESHEHGSQYVCIRIPDEDVAKAMGATATTEEWSQPVWRWKFECCFCRISELETRVEQLEELMNQPRSNRSNRSRPNSNDISDDITMLEDHVANMSVQPSGDEDCIVFAS